MQKQNLAIVIDNRTRGQIVSICSVHQVQPGRLTIRHGGAVGPLFGVFSQLNEKELPVVIVGRYKSKDSGGFTEVFSPPQLQVEVLGWLRPDKPGFVLKRPVRAIAFQPEWGAVELSLHKNRSRECAKAARLAVSMRENRVQVLDGDSSLVKALEWGNVSLDPVKFKVEFSDLFDTEQRDGRCRECGCTDERACFEGCTWVEADLCSGCTEEARDDLSQRPFTLEF